MIGSVAVLIILSITLVDCKYCWHKNAFGKTSHFYCSAFQYCCGEECCENMEEFYKLWYFWLCVIILGLSICIACYWLRRRYMTSHPFGDMVPESRSERVRQRRRRRYRQLTGDSTSSAPPMVIPDSVVTSPPPYQGDNTGCPHPGPPPYILGSGTSINSATLPRFPPPYDQIEKEPPPLYASVEEVVACDMDEDCEKLKQCKKGGVS